MREKGKLLDDFILSEDKFSRSNQTTKLLRSKAIANCFAWTAY